MIETEIVRLARAVNGLRPDWPAQSLKTFIEKRLADHAYRDAALAMAWIATDPATQTPARVLEAGPWWDATRTATAEAPRPPKPRCVLCGHIEAAHTQPGWGCTFTTIQPHITPAPRPREETP